MNDHEKNDPVKQSDRNLSLDSDQKLGHKLGLIGDKDNQQENPDPTMVDPNQDTVRAVRESLSHDNYAPDEVKDRTNVQE